jgi:hypothetical protein
MIDAVWLLWSRARVDYAKAATVWLLSRMRGTEQTTPCPAVPPPYSSGTAE